MDEKAKADRAWLRERFISLQINLKGANVCVEMYGNTVVDGTWQTTDGTFQHLMVTNLQTPRRETLPKAVLRMSDIISITIPQ